MVLVGSRYEHLSAPYHHDFAHLYVPLSEGERMKLCNLLVTGERHFSGAHKGCGLDISKLETDGGEDDEPSESMDFCEGVFPLHNPAAKDALEANWMPLDWPSKLPVEEIKEYFGEEVRSTSGRRCAPMMAWLSCCPRPLVSGLTSSSVHRL
jgi:hypothetical protein